MHFSNICILYCILAFIISSLVGKGKTIHTTKQRRGTFKVKVHNDYYIFYYLHPPPTSYLEYLLRVCISSTTCMHIYYNHFFIFLSHYAIKIKIKKNIFIYKMHYCVCIYGSYIYMYSTVCHVYCICIHDM